MNQYDLSDDKIKQILERYKRKQLMDKNRYHNIRKIDPEFVKRNRERAREHYALNKDIKKEYYETHIELKKARSLVNYYTKLGRLDEFKEKYPERWEIYSANGSATGSGSATNSTTGSTTGSTTDTGSGEGGGSTGSTSTTG